MLEDLRHFVATYIARHAPRPRTGPYFYDASGLEERGFADFMAGMVAGIRERCPNARHLSLEVAYAPVRRHAMSLLSGLPYEYEEQELSIALSGGPGAEPGIAVRIENGAVYWVHKEGW